MRTPDELSVLLVEDDAGIGRVIRNGLKQQGIELEWVRAGVPALERLRSSSYDAVILDLMLPDIDGFSLCREIRKAQNRVPICMLTARDALEDKLEGFEVGADDYLTKPFEVSELAARLGALVRRANREDSEAGNAFGTLRINPLAREATIGDVSLELTRREFDVLAHLTRHSQQVVSRSKLLEIAWGAEREVTLNTVDVYIGYLRRKLSEFAGAPQIKAVRGIGFKLC